MKFVNQTAIILLLSLVGEFLYYLLPFSIPAGVYGLLIMLILLLSGIVKMEQIENTGQFLIDIMPLMFVPPIAGLLGAWGELRKFLPAFVTVIILSTIAVMAVSGKITQKIIEMRSYNE